MRTLLIGMMAVVLTSACGRNAANCTQGYQIGENMLSVSFTVGVRCVATSLNPDLVTYTTCDLSDDNMLATVHDASGSSNTVYLGQCGTN